MKRWLWVLLIMLAFIGYARAKISAPEPVLNRVRQITQNKAKILGVEKAPFGKFYIVFFEGPSNRVGAVAVSEDGRFLILGRILDFSSSLPKDVIFDMAKARGYLKPPKPRKVDMSKINLKETPLIGKKGTPSIVLYFDPTCPFCKKELGTLRGMVEKGVISFYPKYFIVHGPSARKKAEEAECIREAYGEKAYFDYLLEGKKPAKGPKCNMEAIKGRIDRDIKEARKLGITGTPTWIYEGKVYVGYRSEKEIRSVVDKKKSSKVK